MDIYKILRLNYYEKLKEWWTNDVDGDCISFNLYRNKENSIILLKRWRGDFRKEGPDLSTMFLFRRVKNRLSGRSVKNKKMEEPMKQKLKIRIIISITVLNLIQIQILELSEYLLIDYPSLKDFQLLYYNIPKRK